MKDRHGNSVPWVKRIDIPPLWLAGTLVIQWLAHNFMPVFTLVQSGLQIMGWVLMLIGFGLILWSALHFRKARTPIHPRRKPTALITSGPFAFSRNPIYLGMAIIALGYAMRLGSVMPFFLIPVFMLIISKRFIAGEEFHVGKTIGTEWDVYASKVRRWV